MSHRGEGKAVLVISQFSHNLSVSLNKPHSEEPEAHASGACLLHLPLQAFLRRWTESGVLLAPVVWELGSEKPDERRMNTALADGQTIRFTSYSSTKNWVGVVVVSAIIGYGELFGTEEQKSISASGQEDPASTHIVKLKGTMRFEC